MDWGWFVFLLGAGMVVLLLWRLSTLRREVDRLVQEQYSRESRLRDLVEEQRRSVETLKTQVAYLASDQPVQPELVRMGRLYREIDSEALHHLLSGAKEGEVFILDVGLPQDYAENHLPSARFIPLEDIETQYEHKIPKDIPILIVYCGTGDRSTLACDFLSRRGWTTVYHLTGGLQQWTGPKERPEAVGLIQIQSRSTVHSS